MYIKNKDLSFLICLFYALFGDEKYANESDALRLLILRLNDQRKAQNEYTRSHIAEKRKIDKNYGRKKAK